MKLARFSADGHVRFGAVAGDHIREFTAYRDGPDAFQRFVTDARHRGCSLEELGEALLAADAGDAYGFAALADEPLGSGRPALCAPLLPEQVWAAALTYAPPAGWNKYAAERSAPRPILFFKGTSSHCVGPNDFIGVRADSRHTIPEPELALVLDETGQVLAYTIGNDVTALDFTNASPLYVSYSKTYERSLALGPVLATHASVPDPDRLAMRMTVRRDGAVAAHGESNTSLLLHSFDSLIRHTVGHNRLSLGTVLCTGGGVWLPFDFTLQPDDVVEIEVDRIGVLRNVAIQV